MSFDLFADQICQRVFLGWETPLLPAVVRYFSDRFAASGRLDLSGWLCVLPSAQSRARLEELLAGAAATQQWVYSPPEILTTGDLAESLYKPERPIAIEFEQTLAWARVLRAQSADRLRPVLPVLPETDSLGPWLELAGTLRRLSADLATHDVTFLEVQEISETDAERARWRLLQELADDYLSELEQAGLSDQHVQRRRAVERKTVQCNRAIALIGTSDLNESLAKVVWQVNSELIALIAAPSDSQQRFDELGRLKTESFSDWELPIRDDQLIAAADIADQTAAVAQIVTEFATEHPPAEIAIGVTDGSHVDPLELQLDGAGFSTYRHVGWTVSASAIGRLIELTATVIQRPTWRSLAALVRHGDVHRMLASHPEFVKHDYLVDLDQLLANHFPINLADPLPSKAIEHYPAAIALKDHVLQWLSPLMPTAPKPNSKTQPVTRPIAQWCVNLSQWLDSIYPVDDDGVIQGTVGSSTTANRQRTHQALRTARDLIQRFAKLSQHLDLPVTAGSALETVAGRLADQRFGQQRQPDDLPIHGWLDLSLDDSPAMVVLGLNHPFVPSAVTSDPFLPGALRTKLRIADNDRRYARDVYAMQLMLATRKEIKFIVGKNAADGSPTPPSRLLAAAPPQDLARRIRNLLSGDRPQHRLSHRWDNPIEKTELPIPQIHVTQCPVQSMSVTAFKSYLECPYRFYLRHVLKLKPIDDSANELAANQFGDLIHGAVENFGESDDKSETDEQRIFAALKHHLAEYAALNYGDHAETAVQLQIKQAERRLRKVATEQALRISQGWVIHATEAAVEDSDGAGITIDGKRMRLRGRFDRIDRNTNTGQWAILDYKTHGHKPEKKHLAKDPATGEQIWIDLQLPLYRMMVPYLGIEVPPQEVQLGYFNVSDKDDETKINLATFTEPLMEEAERLIEDCVRRIFACDFAPTSGRVMYDDYEMILQTGIASRMLEREGIAQEAEEIV
ncbi:PD-(D/E)XK nuclease family protein [Stieleria sp. TO1_6]|uniref:PD-(D/E)XK nuclease family protein n=1 Tax=Stieleria tagensis TaxID=2956795 RepID=UPI00209B7508|nr:PD-(D/E)XK nuclease family protein [Stieleria tagensis]MCO8123976.1 PD-(D/E)XK nuclease family protein [Stieleria tagensis]